MAGLSDYDDFRYYYAEEEDKTRQERGDSYSPAINLSSRRIYTSGGVRNVIPSENYVSYNRAYRNVSSPLQNQNYSLGFTDNNGLPSSAYSTPEEEDPASSRFTIYKGIGLVSVIVDNLLSHPFMVFRRQCQVHVQSRNYHLSPITLIRPIFHICQRQGCSVLWKGLGSSLFVRGMVMAVEDVTSKVTPWPKEITRHNTLKSVCQHILLKSLSLAIITPFYSASLVESCQSEVASETAGFFDVFREGLWRVLSWPSTGRLVPLHVLVVPTVAHGVLSYLIYTGIKSVSLATIKRVRESKERKQGALSKDSNMGHYSEMSASLVGHMVADILLFPLETILHRLHLQGTRTIIDSLDCGIEVTPIITSYGGVLDCVRTIVDEEGFSGLYKGFGALIMQVGVQLLILRTVKIICEQTTFGFGTIKPLQVEGQENNSGMSQSVSDPGNINRASLETTVAARPDHFGREYPTLQGSVSASGSPRTEARRPRLSPYQPI